MDVLSAGIAMKSIAAGAQANAALTKMAMVEAEQNAQILLETFEKANPSVNPPHLGKHLDVFA